MIKSPSAELVDRLCGICQQWFKVGACCDPADRPRAEQAITEMYRRMGVSDPPSFVWVDSPNQANLHFSIARRAEALLWSSLGPSLWAEMELETRRTLFRSLSLEMDAQFSRPIRSSLSHRFPPTPDDHQTMMCLDSMVQCQVLHRAEPLTYSMLNTYPYRLLIEETRFPVEVVVQAALAPQYWVMAGHWRDRLGGVFSGQHAAPWVVLFLGAQDCGVKFSESDSHLLGLWAEIAQSCGWWWPRHRICVVSERPIEVHWQSAATIFPEADHRLVVHKEGGPAVRFRDGWAVWALNGVGVPKRVAETPGEQMPLDWWLDEMNVEVRSQIERKIGARRIMQELQAQEIHRATIPIGGEEHIYAVLEIALKNGRKRRLLEMTNPSTGETHREWIPPHIARVRDALSFRNNTRTLPEKIT